MKKSRFAPKPQYEVVWSGQKDDKPLYDDYGWQRKGSFISEAV